MNCWVAPAANVAGLGVTAIEVMEFAVTVRVAVPLTPLAAAVMVEEPAATAVASPEAPMVATDVFEEVHVTEEEMFAVVPLL